MKRSDASTVILVSADGDAALERLAAELRRGGAEMELLPEVYSAMARLARQPELRLVGLDVRRLDDEELAFVRLAGRYFPEVTIYLLDLPGSAERMRRFGQELPLQSPEALSQAATGDAFARAKGDVPVLEPAPAPGAGPWPTDAEAVESRSRPGYPANPDAEQQAGEEVDAAAIHPLTNDAAHPAAGRELSMEEAVRRRMGDGSGPRVQRRPPERAEPMNGNSAEGDNLDDPRGPAEGVQLSSEEREALLRNEESAEE